MDATKKKILESIGCIVASTQEYLRAIDAESEFCAKIAQTCKTLDISRFPLDFNADSIEKVVPFPHPSATI